MELIKETDKRFVNIEKKIGLFVFIAVIVVVIVAILIGINQDTFTHKKRIYFNVGDDSAKYINKGMSVTLKGFKIGRVKKLSMDDSGKVKAELSILNKYMKLIKADSKAKLIRAIFLGDSVIEITVSASNARQISENDIIAFERTKQFTDIDVDDLMGKISPMLTNAKQITGYLNSQQGDFKQAIESLKMLPENLSSTIRNIDTFTMKLDKNMETLLTNTNNVFKAVDNILVSANVTLNSSSQTVIKMNDMIGVLNQETSQVVEKVNHNLDGLLKIMNELKTMTQQVTPQIPYIVEKGTDLIEETNVVVESLTKIWPIRSHIERSGEKILKIDSAE